MKHENAKEKIDSMMILPRNFKSFLMMGTNGGQESVLVVKKVGDSREFISLLGLTFKEDPELARMMKFALMLVDDYNKESNLTNVT